MARGNQVAGKVQRSFYLPHDVVEALRTAAFERRESQSEIVERALRKELGLMTTAERIAERFAIGSQWELEDGTRLIDVLEAEAERQERRDAITIYRFSDGSAIVTAEEGWWDTLEGAVAAGLVIDPISVINPWTGAWKHIDRSEITAERLETMAQLMEDDIREELHRECPDDPAEFFARYVKRVGPERAGEVWFS